MGYRQKMRAAEIALMLVPAVLAIAWILGFRGLTLRGLMAVLLVLSAIAGFLVRFEAQRGFTGRYQPARLQGTAVVPGTP